MFLFTDVDYIETIYFTLIAKHVYFAYKYFSSLRV